MRRGRLFRCPCTVTVALRATRLNCSLGLPISDAWQLSSARSGLVTRRWTQHEQLPKLKVYKWVHKAGNAQALPVPKKLKYMPVREFKHVLEFSYDHARACMVLKGWASGDPRGECQGPRGSVHVSLRPSSPWKYRWRHMPEIPRR